MKRIRQSFFKRERLSKHDRRSSNRPSLGSSKEDIRKANPFSWSEEDFANYAPHPRFGQRPRRTGLNPQTDFSSGVYLHWHSPEDCRVSDTAITANTEKQLQPTVAVTHYYDVKRLCRDCKRPFLFFAVEQAYWYEELQLPLEADCVRCTDCRSNARELSSIRAEYETLVTQEALSLEESVTLIRHGLRLVGEQVFGKKVLQRLAAELNQIAEPLQQTSATTYESLRTQMQSLQRTD